MGRYASRLAPNWQTVRDLMLTWVRQNNESPERMKGKKQLRIADVFCGCGGLTLGAKEAARRNGLGIDIRLAVDSDPSAIAVYRANFSPGGASRDQPLESLFDGRLGEVPTTREKMTVRQCGPIDILLAGPPCQGHSDLNNSTRRNDPRNSLYLRAARAIEVLKPRFAFIENVPSVVHDISDVVGAARRNLGLADYHLSTTVVGFEALGLPQRRRRHILFASRLPQVSIEAIMPQRLRESKVAVGPFITDLMDEPEASKDLVCRPSRMTEANRLRVDYLFENGLHDLPDKLRPPCHRDKPHSYQSVYGRMHWSKPAQTITSGFGSMGQGRYVHPRRRRMITPHEAARIQGFPDFFDFSAAGGLTALRTMIGNAVPPPLMMHLLGRLFQMKFL